jgi:hypothetical protein
MGRKVYEIYLLSFLMKKYLVISILSTLLIGIGFAKGAIKEVTALPIKKVVCQNTGTNCKTNYYKAAITYLGTENEGLSLGFSDNFEKHQILFNPIILEDKKTFSEEEFINKIN